MNQPAPQVETRIGDVEREQAVSALGEHYLAGRLTKEEYDERAAAAWTAKTESQLRPLFWDLPVQRPAPSAPKVQKQRPRRRRRGVPIPLLVGVVVVLAVLGVPWWGWLLLAWLALASLGRSCR